MRDLWLAHLEHSNGRQLRCQLLQSRNQFVVSLGRGFHVTERLRIRDERRHGSFPYRQAVERGSLGFVGKDVLGTYRMAGHGGSTVRCRRDRVVRRLAVELTYCLTADGRSCDKT